MTSRIQVSCNTKEEMEEIRQSLIKELGDKFDFDEMHVYPEKDYFVGMFPEVPKENKACEKLKEVSDRFHGARFSLVSASVDGYGVTWVDYDKYMDGKSIGCSSTTA